MRGRFGSDPVGIPPRAFVMRLMMGLVAAAILGHGPAVAAGSADRGPPCDLLDGPLPMEQGVPVPLKIGYRGDASPFSYTDGAGRAAGYSVGLCSEIGGALVGPSNLQLVEVTAMSRFEDLAEGRIDLLCDSSTLTLRRAACFDHTLLTFPSGPALAVAPSLPGVQSGSSVRVGVLSKPSSTAMRAYADGMRQAIARALGVKSVELVEMDSYTALFEALGPVPSAGSGPDSRLGAVFADREILLDRAGKQSGAFTVRDTYFSYEPYTIYLRPNRDLRVRADAALTAIYGSPVIHRLLNDNFARLADTVGQLIKLQRIPID